MTTHDLRRTFIFHLILRLGVDPVRVAKIAGHSNVTVTLNTYADEFDKARHRDDLVGASRLLDLAQSEVLIMLV
jgi:integrase